MSLTTTVTEHELDDALAASPVPVVLYVHADWCGPCKALDPIVEEVSAELGGRVRVLKLDYDQAEQARGKYAIEAVPTLVVTVGGVPVARILGALEKDELLAQLRPLLSVCSVAGGSPASPRETEVVDPTPEGWTSRGPRLLTFPDTLSGRIGVFPSWIPDQKLVGPAHGTVQVPAGRIVWLFVSQTGADPVDLRFLRQLPADGVDRLTVRASAVKGSGLADLAHLTGLSRLSVHAKRLTQPASYSGQLAGLRQVDALRLDMPEADDRMITDVVALPRLRELYLCSQAVTDAGVARLAGARALRSLYLDTHLATDAALAELACVDLPELTDLGICLPETTDTGLAHLATLTGLRSLTVTAPKVTSAGLRPLAQLRNLTSLSLYNTPVDDGVLDALGALRTLTSLTIVHDTEEVTSQVSDAAWLRLRTAAPDITINGVWLAPQAVQHILRTAV
ncbi:thioredoxin domain-containing protein [Streptomyces sp. NPDC059629]|uniref:thioredoxin domain-containing protein n=1 Tax=Streptomyces sp. NPDC059629 TaxID=3346889 RepID=UPI003690CCA6